MNPLIHFRMTTLPFLIRSALACFATAPKAQALVPVRHRTRTPRPQSKVNARKVLLGAAGALCLLVSACQKQMPADAYGSSRDPTPEGAQIIDEATYRAYKDRGEWFAVTKRTAADLEKAEAAQDAADEATVAEYARAHPELRQIIPPDPPEDDPTVTKRADGNFDHVVQISDHERIKVVTHGRRWWLRLIANRIRVFPTRENQLGLYKGLYHAIPEDWRRRLRLATPDAVAADRNMTADAILALNKSIARPEIATPIINSLKAPPTPILLPPMFLADCANEIGYGAESDLTNSNFTGTCDFASNGIVRNYNFTLRPYLTCVKSQANRGTCSAFADVAAIETLVGKIHGQRVNLSEQAFYNRSRTKWDTPYGIFDGLMVQLALKGMADDAWLLYFENQWNYNPSNSRVMTCLPTPTPAGFKGTCKAVKYTDSCKNYSETCSDTIYQSGLFCVNIGSWKFCGFAVPEKNPNNQGYRIGFSWEFWDPTDLTFSITAMRFYLASGFPVVFGTPITTAWDCAEISSTPCPAGGIDGYMQYVAKDTNRGGHGICAVGFIDNADLATVVPGAPPGQGGGYFIVKNSWGNYWGDGGFIYVPYQAMMDYAGDTTVLLDDFWHKYPGCAKDIGVGGNGAVWVIGCSETGGGYVLRRWDEVSKSWKAVLGGGVRIAVGPDGQPWLVNINGDIYRGKADLNPNTDEQHKYDLGKWDKLPGCGKDIAVGASGGVWLVGCSETSGSYVLRHWDELSKSWKAVPGGGVRIAVGPDTKPWLVNNDGNIYSWKADGSGWDLQPGCAKDIAVGAQGATNGALWVVGCDKVSGGWSLHHWTGVFPHPWERIEGGGTNISVAPDGRPWIVNDIGNIYRRDTP
jgi:Tectonin domain/Papain family cysteine protease